MKSKRRILSVGLAIVVLGTSFIVGSGVKIDPVLQMAEEAAKIGTFARREGLEAHARSAMVRVDKGVIK